MHREFIERLKTECPGPLTPNEKKLLQDIRFLIDFILDHDLDISLAVHVIGHDFSEIVRQGSLDKAISKGFLPKSFDYSNYE
ncbi:hypothetical protein BCD64_13060 [Nostoc sp. MBR 210]|nr:hypothetical protein BCD64_13060 [Nostoc sp. MBR 210]